MVQDWERIGDLMVLAVNQWATYRPCETLKALEDGTLAERAYAAAKETQEQIYRTDDKPGRMDMWEAVREERVLLREEATWDTPVSDRAEEELKKKGFGYRNPKNRAQILVSEYLEKNGIPWEWSPAKEKAMKAQAGTGA